MWIRPYCQNGPGFNNPPSRPTWSQPPRPVHGMPPRPFHHMPPGPVHHMPPRPGPHVPPRGPNFFPVYPAYTNNFYRPPHPPQHKFQNGYNPQSNINQSAPSLQNGSLQKNAHKHGAKNLGNPNQNSNHGNKGQNDKKNKKKNGKKTLPESFAFYCDVCDRGFQTDEKLKEHVDGHQKCKEEGCSYVAAPKLVQLHVKNHHYTGLAKKIWNVESEEDILKWIAERKKNFPTAANVEMKKSLEAEKNARGEVLNEKQFYHRPHEQTQRRRGRHGQKWKRHKFDDSFTEDSPPEKKKAMEKEMDEANHKQNCDKNDATEFSDPLATILTTDSDADLNAEHTSTPNSSKSMVLPSSLKALQTMYDSDGENGIEKNSDENSKSSSIPPCDTTILKDLKNSRNHKPHERKAKNQEGSKEAQELAKRPWHSKVFKRERPTLLEKLLAKEIRHERNVILQCIRYIVKNNFFEKSIPASQ